MSDTPSGTQGVPNIAFTGVSFSLTSGTVITSDADGNITFTNALGTSFGLLKFGGTTNAFPALKRVTTSLQARLADDSAFTLFSASSFGFGTFGSRIDEPANGILRLLNAAGTDFTRLMFGGSTAAFPALTRNGTALETKLADDSAYAPHRAVCFIASGVAVGVAGTTSIGGITQATIGAAGAAAALPAFPLGYMRGFVGTVPVGIPYYTQ